ncbi:MAG: hypothetical protein LUC43_05530 [Burkholderiales bacterium]|nr:hypothetical protein [Burkholderiales bacterium]
MDQVFFSKTKWILLFTTLLSLGANFSSAQTTEVPNFEEKPILGIIVPGKTTVTDFKEILNKRGCKYTEDTAALSANNILTVKIGCFDLPGDPDVIVAGQTASASSPIDAMWINFRKDEIGSTYETYLEALTKAYGTPFSLSSPPHGRRESLWAVTGKPLLVIVMNEKGQDGKSSILYMIGDTGLSFLKERGIEPNPKAHEDLNNL